MSHLRRLLLAPAAALSALALAASPASAIVGGNDAEPGEYPSVAEVVFGFGMFGCTGTLIAPQWVLTAGHCGSVTGATGVVSSPAAWPAQSFDVTVGSHRTGDGERVTVAEVIVSPRYLGLFENRHDVALLRLAAPATKAPTQIASAEERSIWTAGTMATIAGWGALKEGGDYPEDFPEILQEAEVPITTDAYAADAYDDFDAETMVAAGFPEGGVDTCQGDSGGPLFTPTSTGTLRVVGATSFGEGCARAGRPGVYARVADTLIRTWIASVAPGAVATTSTSSTPTSDTKTRPAKGKGKSSRAAR